MDIYNIVLYDSKIEMQELLELNSLINKKNLVLSKHDIQELIINKNNILKNLGRVEISNNILKSLIYEFYDLPYIDKSNYLELFEELTNIFYLYQDEFWKFLTDEQLMKYIKDSFMNNNGILESLYDLSILKKQLESGSFYEEYC